MTVVFEFFSEIKMLARFLGDDIEKNLLANDEKLLRKIISATSFQSMQKNDKVFVSLFI